MSASASLIPQEKLRCRRSAWLSVRSWPLNLKIGVVIVTLIAAGGHLRPRIDAVQPDHR